MNAIEDRIRRGLDADVSVSTHALFEAAAAGAMRRRRQQRWAVGAAAVCATAVTAVAVALAAVPDGESKKPGPVDNPTLPLETPNVTSTPPPLSDWSLELDTDGTTVYLATRSCPRELREGVCEARAGELINDAFTSGHQFGSAPVSLWRYDGRGWASVGRVPDVSTPDLSSGEAGAPLMRVGSGVVAFVPVGPGDVPTGQVVVSADEGESWETWQLPWSADRCSSGTDLGCRVEVSGEYVVAASGATWMRRAVGSADWDDISPPRRTPRDSWDDDRFGLLALDDGTLVATVDDFPTTVAADTGESMPGKPGHYRVSRDAGSTWSESRNNPGAAGEVVQWDAFPGGSVEGETVYAQCLILDPVDGEPSSQCERYWSSDDLVHWTKVPRPDGPDAACPTFDARDRVDYESIAHVGSRTYALAHVPYVDGHVATWAELPHLDMPHDVRHVLVFSTDGCRTWSPLLQP